MGAKKNMGIRMYEVVEVKTVSFLVVVTLVICSIGIIPVLAAAPEEIEASIESGLAWLAASQNGDGSWGDFEQVGYTSFALLKMEDRAFELGYDSPFDAEYAYSSNVESGFDYLFDYYYTGADSDGDGIVEGYFDMYGWHQTYHTATSLMAIASSGTPDRVVLSANPNANGKTFQEIAEECVEWFAATQNPDGGWRYSPGQIVSDQSNTGWVTMALTYSNVKFGVDVSEVYPGLQNWVDIIQNKNLASPYYGGSMYEVGWGWENILKTGSLLYQFAMLSTPDTDPDVQAAIQFIETYWTAPVDTGWTDHRQAMFCLMKGLEAYNVELLDLDGDGIPEADWFDIVSTHLVTTQNVDGSWPADPWGDPEISTAWALLTLERTVIVPIIEVPVDFHPGSCPNPFNLGKKGVIPAAILGSEDFDVSGIDPASIKLITCDEEDPAAGVSPVRWSYETVAQPVEDGSCDCEECDMYNCWEAAFVGDVGDEYIDLTLKFDSVAVSEYLGEVDPGCIKMKLVGNLTEEEGGQAFEGCDTLKII